MNKVLVTGGCGFIGSHLVERLVKMGKEVTVADVLQMNVGMLENLEYVIEDIRFMRCDLRDFNSVMEAVKGHDTIFHLGAISHLPYCHANPLIAVETNFMGTVNILEACRVQGVKNLLYAGTDHIYGVTDRIPIPEDLPPKPKEIYALTKAHAVQLCKLYNDNYGVNVKVLVSSNVFGERQDMPKAIPIFSKAAWSDMPIVVNGGKQTRDFYYVENLVDAYLLVADKGVKGECYNVSGDTELSVTELVNKIVKITGSQSHVTIKEYRSDETPNLRLKLDTTKIKTLGWREKVGLDEGLKRTVEWYNIKKSV